MIRVSLEERRSTIPYTILSDETGGAVESPRIDVLPASRALLIRYRWSEVATDLLYHQLADGPVHFGGVSDACFVG